MDFVKELVQKLAAFIGQVMVALGFVTDEELGEAGDKADDFVKDWDYIVNGQ